MKFDSTFQLPKKWGLRSHSALQKWINDETLKARTKKYTYRYKGTLNRRSQQLTTDTPPSAIQDEGIAEERQALQAEQQAQSSDQAYAKVLQEVEKGQEERAEHQRQLMQGLGGV